MKKRTARLKCMAVWIVITVSGYDPKKAHHAR
jgi:hypothetical protein